MKWALVFLLAMALLAGCAGTVAQKTGGSPEQLEATQESDWWSGMRCCGMLKSNAGQVQTPPQAQK